MKQICENCGTTIDKPELAFRLKIEMFADPSPPEFDQQDLEADFAEELRGILEQMEQLDPREAEDEVHEAYLFTLCGVCRRQLHDRLRDRQLPFEQHY